MVRHTHQDFLSALDSPTIATNKYGQINLAEIKDFNKELDLFDIPGKCFRKVNLSYLDEYIDDLNDWDHFIKTLIGVDCLYLVDDRPVSNPIMRKFGKTRNLQYLSKLHHDNIPALIVDP